MKSSRSETRARAARKLRASKDPGVFRLLLSALGDTEGSVRLAARDALDDMRPGWKVAGEATEAAQSYIATLKQDADSARRAGAGVS